MFVGADNYLNPTIVCKSKTPNNDVIRQRTERISLEYNVKMNCTINGLDSEEVLHVFKCYAETTQERDVFLQLTPLFEAANMAEDQEDAFLELFDILSAFFKDRTEPSNRELQGLFAELLTIWSYRDRFPFSNYWHTNENMKYDFSISERVKVEVKSTTRAERIHRFSHEQLINRSVEIVVISYRLQEDDQGLSLFDLIQKTKPLFIQKGDCLLLLTKFEKNVSEDRLKSIKYNEELAVQNRKIIPAKTLPQFPQAQPSGVFNAVYDCDVELGQEIGEDAFFDLLEATRQAS